MDSIGVAVIGAGILGTRHARAWHEQPETHLVVVADISEDRARPVAEKYGARWTTDFTTFLHDPEIKAVSVATPDFLHYEPAMASLEAGKDVLIEKPLATNMVEAQKMVAVAQANGRIFQANFSQRFMSEYAYIKETIERGEIGRPVMIQSLKHDTIYVPTGMIGWAAKTSPVYFMTSHDLDLIRWYLGAEPVKAVAYEVRGTLESKGVAVHDGLQGMVHFDDDTAVNFHTSWIHPETFPSVSDSYFEIIGTQGVMIYRSRPRELEIYTSKRAQTVTFSGPATATEVQGKLTGAFVDSVRLFIKSIQERSQPMTAAANSLKAVACQVALLESARAGGVEVEVN